MKNIIYTSIQQQYYKDALKYLERAKFYADNNQFVHCTGCLRKASRKLELAKFWDDDLDIIAKNLIHILSEKIAIDILEGSSAGGILKIISPE